MSQPEAASPPKKSAENPSTVAEKGDGFMTPTRTGTSGGVTPLQSPKLEDASALLTTPMISRCNSRSIDEDEEDKTCAKWSDVLKTPSDGDKFSPSREINKPGSLHGLGLMVATDRAKKLSQMGRRCASLFFDIAALQDTFAQALLAASCQMTSCPASNLFVTVNRSRISFARQLQGLAICVRGSIARPLHGTMTSLGETAPSIYERYAATRVSCAAARQAALRMRLRYAKAVREAEGVIQEMRQAKKEPKQDGETEETDEPPVDGDAEAEQQVPAWERNLRRYCQRNGLSPDQLIKVLHEVQSLETQYKKLVEEENQAVSQAQTMEIMALEAAQKLEEERLQFFVESMNRVLTAEKGALDKMVLSAEPETQDETPEPPTLEKKASATPNSDFFSKKIFKSNSQALGEGVGVMEAETLGLPEEVGRLRDEVKSRIAGQATRAQVVKSLSTFLEEIADAVSAHATSLESRIGQEGYNDKSKAKNIDPLADTMKRSEGPHVAKYWQAMIRTVDETVKSARKLSENIRMVTQEKLDPFILLRADRDAKTALEQDDQRWKQLCEAARNETKAQMRYQEANSKFEKARERVKSVDSNNAAGGEQRGSKAPKMKPGMSKALGNVLSILPDGGDKAMQKMLTSDARRAIAQTTFEEADQKENQEKQALDTAKTAKAQALKSYSAKAEGLVASFKKDDENGWADVEVAMKTLYASLEGFRSERHSSVDQTKESAADSDAQMSDMAEWTERAKNHLKKKAEKNDDASTSREDDGGFALTVELEKSGTVYKLLNAVEIERVESGLNNDPAAATSSDDEASPAQENDLLDSPVEVVPKQPLSSDAKELLSIPSDDRSQRSGDTGTRSPPSPPTPERLALQKSSSAKADTEVFLAHFWADREEGEEPPTVIESYSCAYWPKEGEGHLSPLLHGRLFVTSSTLYFVGWGEKKIVLNLEDVVSVTKDKNLMGTIDNSLRIVCNEEDGESSYFFGSFAFRDSAYHLLVRLSTVARSLRELKGPSPKKKANALPDVPPDQLLKKMDTMVSKKIKNVSVQRFFDIVWSEGEGAAGDAGFKPFYGPFLVEDGNDKVNVPNWEVAETEADYFTNDWCGEKYSHRRLVTYEFTRTTHLYVGPPVAGVKQLHHCVVQGNDKCVLAMTMEFDGIPYGDTFSVEIRWVARRIGSQDLHVDAGVYVNFKKSVMFAKKIRSGTFVETKPIHESLFESIKKACLEAGGGVPAVEEEEEEESVAEEVEMKPEPKNLLLDVFESLKDMFMKDVSNNKKLQLLKVLVGLVLLRFVMRLFRRTDVSSGSVDDLEVLNQKMDNLQDEMKEIHNTLKAILAVLDERNQAIDSEQQ